MGDGRSTSVEEGGREQMEVTTATQGQGDDSSPLVVYKQRWAVLVTVTLLNISNAAVSGGRGLEGQPQLTVRLFVLSLIIIVITTFINKRVKIDISRENTTHKHTFTPTSTLIEMTCRVLYCMPTSTHTLCLPQLWINIAPVSYKAASYFGVSLDQVNWFSLVFLFVSIPFCFISTFSVNQLGLKAAVSTTGIFYEYTEGYH